ncbi:copper amine oxidase N-terminal domain-containing protein [Anaerobacillus sp. MEB173]|uniref:copper amine oxidase N-terminal domain-containing protein n=1 Tax=Anaerobacillus sp. MEB173 TaxID=3383345 RepID=UPI003F918F53
MNGKTRVIAFFLLFFLALTPSTYAVDPLDFDYDPIYVFIDGKEPKFTNDPIIEKGTTLIEFRPVFEELGLKVGWNQKSKKITGEKSGLKIEMTLGNKTATVNGNKVQLQVAPKVVDGRTLVPLRFVGEASGKKVQWNGNVRMILINDGKYEKINTAFTVGELNDSFLQGVANGRLGAFEYSKVVGLPLGEVVNRYGFPDARHNGTPASDDVPSIRYGNYFITFLGNDTRQHHLKRPYAYGLNLFFDENVTNRAIVNALGDPDDADYGMHAYYTYYLGNYNLVMTASSLEYSDYFYYMSISK